MRRARRASSSGAFSFVLQRFRWSAKNLWIASKTCECPRIIVYSRCIVLPRQQCLRSRGSQVIQFWGHVSSRFETALVNVKLSFQSFVTSNSCLQSDDSQVDVFASLCKLSFRAVLGWAIWWCSIVDRSCRFRRKPHSFNRKIIFCNNYMWFFNMCLGFWSERALKWWMERLIDRASD